MSRTSSPASLEAKLAAGERQVRWRLLERTTRKPLLLIAGVDSDDSIECHALLRYAFSNGTDNPSTVTKLGDITQEDSVADMGADSRLILNTLSEPDVLPGSALFDQIIGLTKSELQTIASESIELYKILSFVEIATLFPHVGIPLQLSPNRPASQVVETWPLVQAFALQDIGPGGFYTQRTSVEDVHSSLSPVYSHVDAACLRALCGAGGAGAVLERQWRGFEALVHSIRNLGRRGTALTCESVAEPLVSFAEFSRMQAGKGGGSTSSGAEGQPEQAGANIPPLLTRGARLLAGTYTSEDVSNPLHGALACSSLPIGQAVHAIAEADHPGAGLRACRTVFLTGGRSGVGQKGDSVKVLSRAYESLRAAVRSSLPALTSAMRSAGAGKGEGAQAGAGAQVLLQHVQVHVQGVTDIHAGVQLIQSDGSEVASVSAHAGGSQGGGKGGGGSQAQAHGTWRRLVYVKVSAQVGNEGRVAYGDTLVFVHAQDTPFPLTHAQDGCVLLPSPSFPAPPAPSGDTTHGQGHGHTAVRVLTDGLPATCVWCCDPEEGRLVQGAVDALSQAVAQATASSATPSTRQGGIQASGRGVGSRVAPATVDAGAPMPNATSTPAPAAAVEGSSDPCLSLVSSLGRPCAPRVRAPTAAPGTQGHVMLLTGGTCRPLEHGALQVFEHGLVVHCPGEGPLLLHARQHIEGSALYLGGDALATVAKVYTAGPASDAVKHAQAAWVDASSSVVEHQTLSFVQSALEPVAGLAGVAQGSAGALSSLAQACIDSARDVLVLQVRTLPDSDPVGMLSRLSSSASLWGQEGLLGLVLPGEGEVRAAVLDAHARWREERSREENTPAPPESLPASLPPSLHAGYLSYACRLGPLAWVQVWEGVHMGEQALLEDARACNGSTQSDTSPPTPSQRVLLVQGPAGGGAAAWARGAVEALGGKLGHAPVLLADASSTDVQGTTQACHAALARHDGAPQDSLLLLVLPPHAPPALAVQAVQAHAHAGGKARVVGAITVLHSRQMYQDYRTCLPLPSLSSQLRPAGCSAVVLLTPSDKDDRAEGVVHRVRRWNAGCTITRQSIGMSAYTGEGACLTVPYPLAAGVMSEAQAAWAHPRAEAVRTIEGMMSGSKRAMPMRNVHVYAPDRGSLAGGATVSHDALLSRRVLAWVPTQEASRATITLHAALDEAVLQDCLRALVTLRVDRPDLALLEGKLTTLPGLPLPYSTPAGAQGVVYTCAWYATGVVRVIQGEGAVYMAVEATPHSVRLHPAPPTSPATPSLTVTGLGMELAQVSQGVQAALLACRPRLLPTMLPRGSASTCSTTDRLACIRASLSSLPEGSPTLPPDMTYDGTGYWDMAGGQVGEHPWAGIAAARYVAVHDAACKVLNACLERVRHAAEEEARVGAAGQGVEWPGREDAQHSSKLMVPALPFGVSATDLSSWTGMEELTLPLPPASSCPWWRQQERASAWCREVVSTYGPV